MLLMGPLESVMLRVMVTRSLKVVAKCLLPTPLLLPLHRLLGPTWLFKICPRLLDLLSRLLARDASTRKWLV